MEVFLNGVGSGQGFLIAPFRGQRFDGLLSIGPGPGETGEVRLASAADSAVEVSFDVPSVQLAGGTITVRVGIPMGGALLNDTVIELMRGDTVTRFQFSAIETPALRFSGRFQCRLATDDDPFDSPFGEGQSSFGSYAVSGPDLAMPDEPPMDRIIRLLNPVGLRPFAEFTATIVRAIEADMGGAVASFTVGDPVLGLPVMFGPQSKFESQDGNFAPAGSEPISNFEFHVGAGLSGRSVPAVPRQRPSDPPGSTAPYANGIFQLDNVGPWKPADFGYPESSWALHALAVAEAKKQALAAQVAVNAAEERVRTRRLQEYQANQRGIVSAMALIESYAGLIDLDLTVTPGDSPMLAYLASCDAFSFRSDFFNFDTDTHCGTVTGFIADPDFGNRNRIESMARRQLQVPRELRDT